MLCGTFPRALRRCTLRCSKLAAFLSTVPHHRPTSSRQRISRTTASRSAGQFQQGTTCFLPSSRSSSHRSYTASTGRTHRRGRFHRRARASPERSHAASRQHADIRLAPSRITRNAADPRRDSRHKADLRLIANWVADGPRSVIVTVECNEWLIEDERYQVSQFLKKSSPRIAFELISHAELRKSSARWAICRSSIRRTTRVFRTQAEFEG